MRNYLKKVIQLSILTLLAIGLFKVFNFAWDYAARDPAKKLSVTSCPEASSKSLANFQMELGSLLNEAGDILSNPSLSDKEVAQQFNSLHIKAEELSYPQCASMLQELVSLSFKYQAQAYSALAQGGMFAQLRYRYYRAISNDYLYLVPFVIRQIMPPLPPLNDGQLHA